MPEQQIDALSVQITSDSSEAVKGIDSLFASLTKLKSVTKGGIGLKNLATNMKAVKDADVSNTAQNLDKLSNALAKLQSLGKLSFSGTIGKNLEAFGAGLRSIDPDKLGQLEHVGNSLSAFSDIKSSGFSSMLNAFKKLPEVVQVIDSIDIERFTGNLDKISASFQRLQDSSSAIRTNIKGIGSDLVTASNRVNRIKSDSVTIISLLTSVGADVLGGLSLITVYNELSKLIGESNEYVESMNLVNASLGTYAKEAEEYADQVYNVLGIDPAQFLRNQGVFNTIINGFGVASDRAYIMSKNLTQLGYDLASFYNLSFEDSMQKVQSAISGELEPVRRLGFDLSKTRLEQEALNLGIEKSFNDMTQAEKAQLRYYTMLRQVTVAQGDMARTINAPANQIRILQSNLMMCARAIGNIFIPMLNRIIPVSLAAVRAIQMLASAIASLFGYKLQLADVSGIASQTASSVGGIADGVNEAANGLGKASKKAKELNNYLMGIDELNVIAPHDDSGSSGSGGGGIGDNALDALDFELPTYDFLNDALETRVDNIVKTLQKLSPLIAAIGAGLMALPFMKVLKHLFGIEKLAHPFLSWLASAAGILLTLGGAVAYVWGTVDALRNGMNWVDYAKILGGILSTSTGLFLILVRFSKPLAKTLGFSSALVGSLGFLITSLIDIKKRGTNAVNTLGAITAALGSAYSAIVVFKGLNVYSGLVIFGEGLLIVYSAIKSVISEGANFNNVLLLLGGGIATVTGAMVLFNVALSVNPIIAAVSAIAMLTAGIGALGLAVIKSGEDAYKLSEDYQVMQKVIDDCTAISDRSATAISNLNANVSALDQVSTDFAAARTLVDAIFDINENADASAYELLQMSVMVDTLNGMGIDGLRLEIDETTGRVIQTRDAIGEVIAKLEDQARAAALQELLTQAYKDQYQSVVDMTQAQRDYEGVTSALAETSQELTNTPWYDISKRSELLNQQKEQTEALNATKDAMTQSMDAYNQTSGAIAQYTTDLVNLKASNGEFGESLSDLQYTLEDAKEHLPEVAGTIPTEIVASLNSNTSQDEFKGWGASILEWIGDVFKDSKKLTDYGYNVNAGLAKGIDENTGLVTSSAEAMSDALVEASRNRLGIHSPSTVMMEQGAYLMEGLEIGITNGSGAVTATMSEIGNSLINAFANSGNGGIVSGYKTIANDIMTGFKTSISSGYLLTKTTIDAWGKATQKWFTDIVSKKQFATNAKDIVDAFKTSIEANRNTALTRVKTWAEDTKKTFESVNTYDSWNAIGKHLVQGLMDGINTKKYEALQQMQRFASDLNSAFTNVMQIHSPSRVFRDYGEYTVEGYNIGIDANMNSSVKMMDEWARRMASVEFSTSHMSMQMDTSNMEFYDGKDWSRSIAPSVTAKADYEVTDNMYSAMHEFYESEMKGDIKQMVEDMHKQANKSETVNVQIGNRTVSDAVQEQRDANGFSFT